tara:strand:- start:618 stop:1034 length:417 start_codon:yes stop_codon:yes gene_type:complete
MDAVTTMVAAAEQEKHKIHGIYGTCRYKPESEKQIILQELLFPDCKAGNRISWVKPDGTPVAEYTVLSDMSKGERFAEVEIDLRDSDEWKPVPNYPEGWMYKDAAKMPGITVYLTPQNQVMLNLPGLEEARRFQQGSV